MERDFSFQNPTRIHFGKKSLEKLAPELSAFGSKILLVTGGGSVRRTGLYGQIMEILEAAGKTVEELSGVPSNPTAAKVYEGIKLARRQEPDLILAVGGGSVIDCAKVVAAGALHEEDFWQSFFVEHKQPQKALPLGVVLTMAGTASEMNGSAVITDEDTKIKAGMGSDQLYPVFSLLNPELTYTVPQNQMVSGICDILSHIMETYMSPSDEDNLSDDLAEAVMAAIIRAAPVAVENPKDYTARSNIMWGATLGLNGILEGSKRGDWMVHQLEHQLGAYTNCPHGLGLAALSGSYYRVVLPHAPDRFYRFAVNVWGVDPKLGDRQAVGLAGIEAMENFFRSIGAPTSLRELGMSSDAQLDEIADSVGRLRGAYLKLTREQAREIFHASF